MTRATTSVLLVLAFAAALITENSQSLAEARESQAFQESVSQIADEREVDDDVAAERLLFESAFGKLADRVASRFPDHYVDASVSEDFSQLRGCLFLTDVESIAAEVTEMSDDVPGTVCLKESRLSADEAATVTDEVTQRLAWIPDEIQVISAYSAAEDRIRINLHVPEGAEFSEVQETRVREDVWDLAPTIDVRVYSGTLSPERRGG